MMRVCVEERWGGGDVCFCVTHDRTRKKERKKEKKTKVGSGAFGGEKKKD